MDTLQELANSLGDDADFATTVTNNLATKLDKTGGTLTGQVTLPNNPTAGTLQAATALYVENELRRVTNLGVRMTQIAPLTRQPTPGSWWTPPTELGPSIFPLHHQPAIMSSLLMQPVNLMRTTPRGRNSENIMGPAEDMTVAKLNASFRLVYANATQGWRIN